MTDTSGPGVKGDVVSLKATEVAAFKKLYQDRYHPIVNRLMFALRASVHDSEDAVQFAFVQAYRRWSQIENPEPWVVTVATRAYLAKCKRDRRRMEIEKRALVAGMLNPHGQTGRELDDVDGYAWVQAVISDLPPRQRQVMAGIADGLSNEEIAGLLGITQDNFRSNLRFARRRLEKRLDLKKMIPAPASETGKGGTS